MDPKDPTGFSTVPTYGVPDIPGDDAGEDNTPAADLIRDKIKHLYDEEPPSEEEIKEAKDIKATNRSKHQQYMFELSQSGMSLAEIQTKWHEYYEKLSDEEKHQVWQEFYSEHGKGHFASQANLPEKPQEEIVEELKTSKTSSRKTQTVSQIHKRIVKKVNLDGKLKTRQHLQSLMFGLGMGSIVVLIFLFSFFNDRIIAPFITPSKKVSSTPIIVDGSSIAVGSTPEIFIPKINVEIPVDYSVKSVDEKSIQKALESGIIHYPTTVYPGEKGNAAFFGHSSNNIFNPGKYKFAFALLRKVEKGDLFYLTRGGKRYVYRVYKKSVVEPTEISVLNKQEKLATATLITCDPPGTSFKRLVVVGEQISPSPKNNKASHIKENKVKPQVLPSNAPTLWERIKNWLT